MKFVCGLAGVLMFAGSAPADDNIYPPAEAAKKAVNFDGRGFIINGGRCYLTSGSIEYSRVPHPLWRDRLMRIQRAGFNTVENYAFWNFHEPVENQWDFTGDRDIEGFLDTAKQLGLYSIMRPGPYVCAEWDSGGWPLWLKFKPEMRLRTDDPAFLAVNDHWYDKILPIIAKHQIHRGGNIILVQLENEHPAGGGVVDDNPYFRHLLEKSRSLGIEVPQFFSGLNHGNNPLPASPDHSQRSSPWLSTEFWAGWFDRSGPLDPARLREVDQVNWSIMARGGGGQNIYMAHGGTNFETWNDASGAASYDYGAPVGQAGDLRPDYFRMKRANQFALSFPAILADGQDASGDFADFAGGAELIGARRSPAGTILFFKNPGAKEAALTFRDGGGLSMQAGEVLPIVRDAVIGDGVKIAETKVRVLAVARNQTMTTVVIHGQPGETGKVVLAANEPFRPAADGAVFSSKPDAKNLTVEVKFPAAGPDEFLIALGKRFVRIVAIATDFAPVTWILGPPQGQQVIVGPHYVGEIKESAGKLTAMLIERPYRSAAPGRVVVYGGPGPAQHFSATSDFELERKQVPEFSPWSAAIAPESAAAYHDATWKSTGRPLQMGADGDTSAFAWYRSTISPAAARNAKLTLQGNDHLEVFLNGKPVALAGRDKEEWTYRIELSAGRNSLAVFASHAGRDKAFGYQGPPAAAAPKGLLAAALDGEPIENWRMRGGVALKEIPPTAWRPPTAATGLPAFFSTNFAAKAPTATGPQTMLRVSFAGLSRGTMWLNGHNLGRYPEKLRLDGLYLPECWLADGRNELKIFDETGASPAGVGLHEETSASREVILVSQAADPSIPITLPTRKEVTKFNQGNLAFKQPVAASASQEENPAAAATDGDPETRWCAPTDQTGQWLSVDLGSAISIKAVELLWERPSRLYGYSLEGSTDGQIWQKLGDQGSAVPTSPDSPSLLSRQNLPASSVRYLRITGDRLDAGSWMSLREVRVFDH